jgi:DNA-binding response OmpR family regulator
MSAKILLVEDDPALGFVIKDNLAHKGFEVTLCRDGEQGFEVFDQQLFDLCIFDVMMPKKDGFTLAQEVRKRNRQVPILFVTAKAMIEDKLEGFRAGGDDYIVKPFSMEELFARIEVFLRRTNGNQRESGSFELGEFLFDGKNFKLTHP